jgi:hypothetical protein
MDKTRGHLRLAIGSATVELNLSRYSKPTVGAGTFPTVDEVQAALLKLEDRARGRVVRQIGSSPLGEPLRVLSVGHGDVQILVVAGVHPNEPIGFHTVFALAQLVIDTPLLATTFTFHFVACLDADASLLNRWYSGPLTVEHYFRWFYRPALGLQPERCFPIPGHFDQPRPETSALMDFGAEIDPDLVTFLHNSDFHGAYCVVNRRMPAGLADEFRSVMASAGPFELRPSDTASWETDGDRVFVVPPIEWFIEFAAGRPFPFGARAHHHFSRALVIDSEVPMWQSLAVKRPRAGYRRSLGLIATELAESATFLGDCLAAVEPALSVETPFKTAVLDMLAGARAHAARLQRPDRAVTAAQYAGEAHSLLHWRRLRPAGMLLRVLDAEIAKGNVRPVIRKTNTRLEEHFQRWCARCDRVLRPRPFPIGQSIAMQAAETLLAAAHIVSEAV